MLTYVIYIYIYISCPPDMSVEGIFRKNGNIRRLKDICDALDRDPTTVNLAEENPVQLAALLKKFLRDMPDPLLTFKLHRLFCASQSELCLFPFLSVHLLPHSWRILFRYACMTDLTSTSLCCSSCRRVGPQTVPSPHRLPSSTVSSRHDGNPFCLPQMGCFFFSR